MSISMSRGARYVTQESTWTNQFLGPLTDSRIRKYALAGRYGEEAQRRAQAKQTIRGAKLVRKSSRKEEYANLLALLTS